MLVARDDSTGERVKFEQSACRRRATAACGLLPKRPHPVLEGFAPGWWCFEQLEACRGAQQSAKEAGELGDVDDCELVD